MLYFVTNKAFNTRLFLTLTSRGGLLYEQDPAKVSLNRNGSDALTCTSFIDALKIFEHDDKTEGIISIVGIGVGEEMSAVERIKGCKKHTSKPKVS